MNNNDAHTANRKSYQKPLLITYGDLRLLTRTNHGGPNFDGGVNPFHKGHPVVTGGAVNIDSTFFEDASGETSDIFD